MSVVSGVKDAKNQASATVAEGASAAEERGKRAQFLAGQQKTSFLSSGLSLEGTPLAVLSATYDTASADVGNIIAGANRSSKNIMGAARTKAIGQVAGMAATMYNPAGAAGGTPLTQTNPFQGITSTGTAPAGGSSFGRGVF